MTAWAIDVSPEGTQIAAIRSPEGPIYIFSLAGQSTQIIKVKHWSNLRTVNWAADGKGLYVVSSNGSGSVREGILLSVDLHGNARALWEHASIQGMSASPDGRHLAMVRPIAESNIWMLENF